MDLRPFIPPPHVAAYSALVLVLLTLGFAIAALSCALVALGGPGAQ